MQHCIQHITKIPHTHLTGDLNAHPTLWYSYTDDIRGKLIAYIITNSEHIPQITNTPTRVTNITLQHLHQMLPHCLTHNTIGHRGQLNMLYQQTTYQPSLQSIYDMITDYNKIDGLSRITRKPTGHNSRKTQFRPISLKPS